MVIPPALVRDRLLAEVPDVVKAHVVLCVVMAGDATEYEVAAELVMTLPLRDKPASAAIAKLAPEPVVVATSMAPVEVTFIVVAAVKATAADDANCSCPADVCHAPAIVVFALSKVSKRALLLTTRFPTWALVRLMSPAEEASCRLEVPRSLRSVAAVSITEEDELVSEAPPAAARDRLFEAVLEVEMVAVELLLDKDVCAAQAMLPDVKDVAFVTVLVRPPLAESTTCVPDSVFVFVAVLEMLVAPLSEMSATFEVKAREFPVSCSCCAEVRARLLVDVDKAILAPVAVNA